jgi:hypothetical protein
MGLKFSYLLYLLAIYTVQDRIKSNIKNLVIEKVIYKSSLWDKRSISWKSYKYISYTGSLASNILYSVYNSKKTSKIIRFRGD